MNAPIVLTGNAYAKLMLFGVFEDAHKRRLFHFPDCKLETEIMVSWQHYHEQKRNRNMHFYSDAVELHRTAGDSYWDTINRVARAILAADDLLLKLTNGELDHE